MIANLNKAVEDAEEGLATGHHEMTLASIGLYWAKCRLLDELKAVQCEAVTGIHRTTLEVVLDIGAAANPREVSTRAEMLCTEKGVEVGDLSVAEALRDLIDAGFVIRGGPDQEPYLHGRVWSAVLDLESDISEMKQHLEDTGAFELRSAQKPNLPDNVTELRHDRG
jgi:hypothetical protein